MLNELYHFATPWAKATKRQINVNRMLGVAANALYPIYCAWSPLPKQRTTQGERMVVSLTTFPLRIGKVHLTIQSILRQSEVCGPPEHPWRWCHCGVRLQFTD